jgi:hypothetical protein
LHGEKGNFYGKGKQFLHADFGIARESKVLELGGNNDGHVRSYLELLKTEKEILQSCRITKL